MEHLLAITVLAVAILAYIVYELKRAGLFTKVEIKTVILGPYLLLYKNAVGPYRNTGNICQELIQTIVDMGMVHESDTDKMTLVGVFFDNPRAVPAHKLRSSIGYAFKSDKDVVAPEDVARWKEALSHYSTVRTGELLVGYIPASRCIAASYPFTTILSVVLGVMRVYPSLFKAFDKAVKTSKAGEEPQMISSIEVYKRSEKLQWFGFPLTNRTELLAFDLPEEGVGAEQKKEQ